MQLVHTSVLHDPTRHQQLPLLLLPLPLLCCCRCCAAAADVGGQPARQAEAAAVPGRRAGAAI
jgi:hypothetical protein